MLFEKTKIDGLLVVNPVPVRDSRGSFARTFCKREFESNALVSDFSQHSLSQSKLKHTVRGLHFQRPPHQETKLVSCVKGSIWDVAVDLRRDSPTYRQWVGTTLSAENGAQFYIPEGFAHGFQSLSDDVAVSYLISVPYAEASSAGIRYDEPAIGVEWPAPPSVISEKDLGWPVWQ